MHQTQLHFESHPVITSSKSQNTIIITTIIILNFDECCEEISTLIHIIYKQLCYNRLGTCVKQLGIPTHLPAPDCAMHSITRFFTNTKIHLQHT
jgi:hypothetical protein